MALVRPALSLRTYGPSRGSHSHHHAQVLVGLSGVLELEVEGRGRRVGPGDGCLVRPGDRHDFEAARGSECLVLDTEVDLWTLCADMPARPAEVGLLARYLAPALRLAQPLATLHGPGLLLEAWGPVARPRGRAIDWSELQAWVQHRLDQPLGVADLAARVHLSPGQFAQRCREAQGRSVLQWLRALRLARARQLRAVGTPVADVARRTGYRSPSALTAALRRADD
ncbi:MAG TPA: AraC family transcriptional regulator [Ramlibacter sp.]|jgi:AraC-like DNA-binding protein|uniref:AraC family transcriptional regulator n=1 Tax=Ramlibacter sp. TaxID=1917967 RepID=UPI002D6E753B|nr:AraC family transcriptional regulator [Ramlibacter sp.]HZY16841.1 AraC family transcriptional regulator [Ramlibacter sp.]